MTRTTKFAKEGPVRWQAPELIQESVRWVPSKDEDEDEDLTACSAWLTKATDVHAFGCIGLEVRDAFSK